MVLLTCDSDINLTLMSSSATEVTAARLQRWQRRGGGVSAHDSTFSAAVAAASAAVAGAAAAVSQLPRLRP